MKITVPTKDLQDARSLMRQSKYDLLRILQSEYVGYSSFYVTDRTKIQFVSMILNERHGAILANKLLFLITSH